MLIEVKEQISHLKKVKGYRPIAKTVCYRS